MNGLEVLGVHDGCCKVHAEAGRFYVIVTLGVEPALDPGGQMALLGNVHCQLRDQPGGLAGKLPALHLIMNQPTRQSEVVLPVYGCSLGSMSWDGSEDPSRRAANYLLRSAKPNQRLQHNPSDDCQRTAKRLSGFWRHILPQTSRQPCKALVE